MSHLHCRNLLASRVLNLYLLCFWQVQQLDVRYLRGRLLRLPGRHQQSERQSDILNLVRRLSQGQVLLPQLLLLYLLYPRILLRFYRLLFLYSLWSRKVLSHRGVPHTQ